MLWRFFDDNFSKEKSKLGQVIDVYKIANDIINLDGVDNIQTYRSDINLSIKIGLLIKLIYKN